jgi:hypothetical protein
MRSLGGWVLAACTLSFACGGVLEDRCVDADRDGFGVACERGPDCDDSASSCTTRCGDEDVDGTPDCRDLCLDRDDDDHGITRPAAEIVGDGSFAVLDCTTDGAAPCALDTACVANDVDDTNAACTDGALPPLVTCSENDPCDVNLDGLVDGTPTRCIVGVDPDFPGGSESACSMETPCLFGPWSNQQCGTEGTGWHQASGTCGSNQGSRMKRCVRIHLQPRDPCS